MIYLVMAVIMFPIGALIGMFGLHRAIFINDYDTAFSFWGPELAFDLFSLMLGLFLCALGLWSARRGIKSLP